MILGHVMRNAITPVVTSLGLIVTGLITGSVFVEQIFGIPGYGNLFVTSLIQRDYPLMMGCTLFGAFLIMMSNLIVDFVYPFLDSQGDAVTDQVSRRRGRAVFVRSQKQNPRRGTRNAGSGPERAVERRVQAVAAKPSVPDRPYRCRSNVCNCACGALSCALRPPGPEPGTDRHAAECGALAGY